MAQKLEDLDSKEAREERGEKERAKREALLRIKRLESQLRLLKQRGELWIGQDSS